MFLCRQEEGPDSSTAAELVQLEDEQVRLKTVLRDGSLLFHSKFHQDWGQLFKSGYQDSRFAKQVGEKHISFFFLLFELSR